VLSLGTGAFGAREADTSSKLFVAYPESVPSAWVVGSERRSAHGPRQPRRRDLAPGIGRPSNQLVATGGALTLRGPTPSLTRSWW
jgi:hypothetical protein